MDGNPQPTIEWYKDGEILKSSPQRHFLPSGSLFFLSVQHSKRESDAGIYWCQAKNELGITRSRNATLRVAVLRDDFRLEPQNTKASIGETVMMECGPPRGSPEPNVAWRKNGQILDMAGSKRYASGHCAMNEKA